MSSFFLVFWDQTLTLDTVGSGLVG